jgi:predicted aspartyl protease
MFLAKPRLWRPLALMFAMTALASPALAIDEAAPVEAAPPPVVATVPVATTPPDAPLDFIRIGVDTADRMTLPVEIGNAGASYQFIIDTGSHRSIVATELAQRLALPMLPPVEIISMAGRETVAAVQLDKIRFGTQVVSDIPVLSIAHDSLGSAGLIGLDGLQNKRLTLDFKKRELSIGKSGPAASSWERNVIVVEARSKFGQLILINSRLDGKKVNVILDTGAELSVGNMALFNSLKQKRLIVPPKQVQIISVTGQPVKALFSVVRALEINTMTLHNVPMAFLDAEPFTALDLADKPSMLLGMGMLRMFDRVAIDFGSRHVDFQMPGNQTDRYGPQSLLALR